MRKHPLEICDGRFLCLLGRSLMVHFSMRVLMGRHVRRRRIISRKSILTDLLRAGAGN